MLAIHVGAGVARRQAGELGGVAGVSMAIGAFEAAVITASEGKALLVLREWRRSPSALVVALATVSGEAKRHVVGIRGLGKVVLMAARTVARDRILAMARIARGDPVGAAQRKSLMGEECWRPASWPVALLTFDAPPDC